MFDRPSRLTVRQAVERIIARMPNLMARTVTGKFSHQPETIVHGQEDIASRIASSLPGHLVEHGCMIVELPTVELDDYGGYTCWIDLTGRQIGEIHTRGDGTIAGVPQRLLIVDVPAIATALLAIHHCENNRGANSRPPRSD